MISSGILEWRTCDTKEIKFISRTSGDSVTYYLFDSYFSTRQDQWELLQANFESEYQEGCYVNSYELECIDPYGSISTLVYDSNLHTTPQTAMGATLCQPFFQYTSDLRSGYVDFYMIGLIEDNLDG